MGADIYLNSVYERQKKEHKVDHLRKVWDGLEADPKATKEQRQQALHEWYAAENKAEDGAYFRDSYNESSLAWLVGLSYWQAGEHLNEECKLHLNEAKRWRDHLAKSDIPSRVKLALNNGRRKVDAQDLAAVSARQPVLHLTSADETEETVIAYFETKKQRFLKMLNLSLELGEELYWSV